MASSTPTDSKTNNMGDDTAQESLRTSQPNTSGSADTETVSSSDRLNDAHRSNVANTTDSATAKLDTASTEASTNSGYNRAGVWIGGQENSTEQKPVRRGPDKFGGRAQE